MSIEQTWQTVSTSLGDTLALAQQIGSRLRGGEVIELVSDVGGGKTTFTKGLVKGAGSDEIVHSPSFTISNQYTCGELIVSHFDFYRLAEPGIMKQELAEVVADPDNVVVVEWADIVEDVLPTDRMTIRITATAENERSISLSYPSTLHYLIPEKLTS